ncbi:30S ribosomal protein S20 [bacterium]|nr:30S ribosomal protein S20 [bacterium]
MPHTKAAKKALRQSHKRRLQNRTQRSALRTLIKRYITTVEDAEVSADDKRSLLSLVSKKLDQSAAKNLIHRNVASRTKSRLAQRLNKATQG